MKTDLFQFCGYCCFFQICWHIKCSTFTASSFRVWNNSAGILSSLLALFIVMLPKAHLTSYSMMSGSRWVITSYLSGSLRSFCVCSYVYSCQLFLISSASVRSIPFLSCIVPIFAWSVPLVLLTDLKRSLVFPILLFSCISYIISPCYSLELCIQMDISFLFSFALVSLLFSAICKASSDNHDAFFAFLFLGDDFDHHLLYNVMNLHP